MPLSSHIVQHLTGEMSWLCSDSERLIHRSLANLGLLKENNVEPDGHMMLDLETWGTGARAVIIEAAAVDFDPTGTLLGDIPVPADCFYTPVDPQSCMNLGMEVDADTIYWWLKQDDGLRGRILTSHNVMVNVAAFKFLDSLNEWIKSHRIKYVWSHGATFDIPILMEYYRRLRRKLPFDHHDCRDTRTLFAMTDIDPEKWKEVTRREKKHHPLHDAWAQARAVQYCVQQEAHETGSADNTSGPGAVGREPSGQDNRDGAPS